MECDTKPILHIEVQMYMRSNIDSRTVIDEVNKILLDMKCVNPDTTIKDLGKTPLKDHVIRIHICELEAAVSDESAFNLTNIELSEVVTHFHLFRLETCGSVAEELGEGDEEVPAATHWSLPSAEFDGVWENLVYDTPIKEQLLKFVQTTMLFSDKGLNKSVISWNKVVLLHGPPGTGKTSLCKALAQKLSIRLDPRYKYAQLVEVNSHSLFSKWFSESGKLVQKMFTKIMELAEDPQSLVIVLIDEVESLTMARQRSSQSGEPGDALRVVNTLLTQLDQINKFPNVLIMTTSNISDKVDVAFIDRADIKQYIGNPSKAAIYKIYCSCIAELMRTGIITNQETMFSLKDLEMVNMILNDATKSSLMLWKIAEDSVGFSGRTLRKMPFLAHALFCNTPHVSLNTYLLYLEAAVKKQKQDRIDIGAEKDD